MTQTKMMVSVRSVARPAALVVCAVTAAPGLGCGVDVDLPGEGELEPAELASGCVGAAAGAGFVTLGLPDASVLDTLTFTAQASQPDIDLVIGLSAGPAARFTDLAIAVRFAPGGYLDVRDGDGYRADVAQPYGTEPRDLRVIADLTAHRYSVFEGSHLDARELARQYRFRTEQRAVQHLDHLAVIVDSPAGSATVCGVRAAPSAGVVYSREGHHDVVPLAGGQALLSKGGTTTRISATGARLAQLARGGRLAVDAAGNVSIASVAGTTLTIDSYDPSFAARWRATAAVSSGGSIGALAADPTGAVLAGVVTPAAAGVTVARFTAGGALASQLALRGHAVAFDGDQPIVAWQDGGTLRVTRFQPSGAAVWSRAFAGSAAITAIAVDPGHAVLLGGELITAIDFGGGPLPTVTTDNGRVNGFLVKLSPSGGHAFSRRTGYSLVAGIAANTARIVVSSTERTQFHYPHLQSFSPAGAPLAGPAFDTGFGEHGIAARVAISATGRVWWNLDTQWPLFPRWPYLVVLSE